jgi:hypothetical protein
VSPPLPFESPPLPLKAPLEAPEPLTSEPPEPFDVPPVSNGFAPKPPDPSPRPPPTVVESLPHAGIAATTKRATRVRFDVRDMNAP